MGKITLAIIYNLAIGILGHMVFFPIIESWQNLRMRRLARPTIGVLLNIVPFMFWVSLLEEDDKKERHALYALVAYCVSFMWNGTGVVVGYLIDDWRQS